MKFRHSLSLAAIPLALTLLPSLAAAQSPQAELTVHYNQQVHAISPSLYGLMTEEINHSYDGGLYAELVKDRVFHANATNSFIKTWQLEQNAEQGIAMAVDHTTGPSQALPYSMKLTASKASASDPGGLDNPGYWGVPVWPDTTYHASIYLKGEAGTAVPVTISIVNKATGKTLASATFPAPTAEWKQYTATLHTGNVPESENNFIRISVAHPGTVWMNLVSLFPPTYLNQKNGDRIDLMKKLAALHPAFLRFPGGNYLEGNEIKDWYDWKKTIGPLVDRPTHPSPWGYQSSDGMGLLEFLEWCQDLHMQPLLAVYAGYSLHGQHVDPGKALAPYVQDAIEEIQYVTGGTDTKWGAERARDGHPAPFPLKYIEIGNEDFFDHSGSYSARFAQFATAIRKAYPDLQLIATTPVKGGVQPDVIDDHFYRSPHGFFTDTTHYDKVSRKGPKIFVGEWATIEGTPTPDFDAALSDAAWMTGLERNSDLVIMASYAPLLVNVNPMAAQWGTNLIGYDALHSFASPSYYAQVLFSKYRGDEVVKASMEGAGPLCFYSATRAGDHLYLKIVNAAPKPQPLTLHLDANGKIDPQGMLVTLSALSPHDINSLEHPDHIVPETRALKGLGATVQHTFAPYSINILVMKLK
uniref:non-reducing end alpha-L-arabinofuranosidase n=1 Tax=Acidobacterium capsulatum TaxID=33075 RepID=A0A7V5CRT9_9BACT